MAEDRDADWSDLVIRAFKDRTNEEKNNLLEGKDKVTTQHATASALKQFSDFLTVKSYAKVEDLSAVQLNEILCEFYPAIRPIKDDEDYSVQSLKCIRAGLNRYMRKQKGIDICKDPPFVKANEMFKAVLVKAKKNGKGVKNSYPPILQIDLERISEYFCQDHMNSPNPKKLQQQMIFYIIYYFCRHGRENLYVMTKNTFQLIIENGTEYVIQKTDEMDKNHGIDDSDKSNRGRMYAAGSKH